MKIGPSSFVSRICIKTYKIKASFNFGLIIVIDVLLSVRSTVKEQLSPKKTLGLGIQQGQI